MKKLEGRGRKASLAYTEFWPSGLHSEILSGKNVQANKNIGGWMGGWVNEPTEKNNDGNVIKDQKQMETQKKKLKKLQDLLKRASYR